MGKGSFAVAVVLAGIGFSAAMAASEAAAAGAPEPIPDPWTWQSSQLSTCSSADVACHVARETGAVGTAAGSPSFPNGHSRCEVASPPGGFPPPTFQNLRGKDRAGCKPPATTPSQQRAFERPPFRCAGPHELAPVPTLAPPQPGAVRTATTEGRVASPESAPSRGSATDWRPGRRQVIELRVEAILVPAPTSQE